MAGRDTLNRVRYSGADQNTLSDEILSRIQVLFASTYNDFAISSLGVMLVDIFSFGLDNLAFYLDRRATDNYLTTARTRKSVAKLARQLGYKLAASTAASVDILVSPKVAQTFIVPFPIGFQVTTPDGSIWESQEAYSWVISDVTPQLLTFSQTETLQSVFTSDGTANQVFNISNVNDGEFLVGPGTDNVSQIIVEINNVAWPEQELLTFGATNQFEIGYQDSPPTLRFGDGIAGIIPPSGAQIRVTFKSSRGPLGSVTANQTITGVTPLAVNFTTVDLNFSNPTGSSGGSPPEDISKAKALAPNFFASRGVNVTSTDYSVRANGFVDSVFGAVAVASAIAVKSSATDAVLQSLVNSITSTSDTFQTIINAFSVTASSTITTLETALQTDIINMNVVDVEISTINTQTASSITANKSSLTSASQITIFSGQTSTALTDLSTAINSCVVGATNQLTSATQTAILTAISAISAANNNTASQAATATTNLSAIAASLNQISTAATLITAQVADITTQSNTLSHGLTALATANIIMANATAVTSGSVDAIGQQIMDHVNSFLASDCQSNLIEVPILAFDSDGFYVAPTIGLINSLQTYLDANKELTQVVKVFSGASLLIAANMSINIGVLTGYVESTIKSQVEAAVLSVLKGRPFGKNLKLSEFYWVLSPDTSSIAGISFVDIAITGPVANINSNGDITILSNQVVTRGVLTLTTEIVSS